LKIDLKTITKEQLIKIISIWKSNLIKQNSMILKDAEKEFDQSSMLGFGNDGDHSTIKTDFIAIRGTYDDNKFVKELRAKSKRIEEKAEWLISAFEVL
jgi:hypothetical protein